MDFMRGNQMVVHDNRLNAPGDPKATPPRADMDLIPPAAKNVWNVGPSYTAAAILAWCSAVALGWGNMDALHFMAHGNKGYLEIGSDGFSENNVDLFSMLKGKVRNIVFFSCLVGGDLGDLAECSTVVRVYAQKVAEVSGAKVVACNISQVYSWSWKTRIINFGDFEGDVFVIYPEGCFDMYNTAAGQPLDLDRFIFGYKLAE